MQFTAKKWALSVVLLFGCIIAKTSQEETWSNSSQDVPLPCGFVRPKCSELIPSHRVTHGRLACAGQVPFQAAIYVDTEGKEKAFRCGATIIDEYHILTAGHCLIV